MPSILDENAWHFFFGSQFRFDLGISTFGNHPQSAALNEGLAKSIENGKIHMGTQAIGYLNVDTGDSSIILVADERRPSMVSFFAQSTHRIFGGSSLVCVPLAFCSTFYRAKGEYLVYRHTFKKPKYNIDEHNEIQRSGTVEEKVKAFAFTKSRDGYETVPGMSYVGITKRSWQKRYAEHAESAMENESDARFHQAIRKMQGQLVVHVHDISAYGIPEAEARAYESRLITESTLWPKGLNMRVR